MYLTTSMPTAQRPRLVKTMTVRLVRGLAFPVLLFIFRLSSHTFVNGSLREVSDDCGRIISLGVRLAGFLSLIDAVFLFPLF